MVSVGLGSFIYPSRYATEEQRALAASRREDPDPERAESAQYSFLFTNMNRNREGLL